MKLVSQRYNIEASTELLYYMTCLNSIFFLIAIRIRKTDIFDIPSNLRFTLLKRVTFGYISNFLLYVSQKYTSYSKGMVIFFTNTLMIPLFAKCLINEKLVFAHIFAIALGFIGMLLTVVPYKDFASLKLAIKLP